ncbi:formyl peptide receptor-related sequence 4-like [Discoglossus pictus]
MESYELSNNFTNTTSVIPVQDDERHLNLFLAMQILSITCYSITFILGIVGNGLVIWIAGCKMKKMVNTILFLNLGIADFLLNIFFPFIIIEWAMKMKWIFGQIMCKIIYTVLYLSMALSTSFLMIISIDRCISVLCPVWSKNHRTPRLAWNISKTIWLLCLIISSPYVVFYDTELKNDSSGNVYCSQVYLSFINSTIVDYQTWIQRHRAMVITRFVTMFLIPFSIILVCYVLIALSLRKNRLVSGSARPFKAMMSLVLCFFCCWFPFHMLRLIDIMESVPISNVYIVWYYFSYCLAFFKSCLNPILYVFIGHGFKKSLMKSIPFLMENVFSERWSQSYRNRAETEMETIHT